MLDKHTYKLREKFSKKLMDFLTDKKVMIWKLNKPIDSYIGDELKKFLKNAGKLVAWATDNKLCSRTNPEWKNMCEALKLWPSIYDFVLKAKVDNNYLNEIKTFKKNVKKFYNYGRYSFLCGDDGVDGQMETAYMHILRYNIAHFAKLTFDRHKLGVGVFTLQGYERRNKESKIIFANHTNSRGNVCLSTMKGLNNKFESSVPEVSMKRKRRTTYNTRKKYKR